MGDDYPFHRRSYRLKGYDYSLPGKYFVTLVTKGRECLFGNVTNKKMILNDAGKNAEGFWLSIPEHYPNVVLDAFIIMPNHVHGIIIITDGKNNNTVSGKPRVRVQNFEPLPVVRYNKDTPREPLPVVRHTKKTRQKNEYQHIIPRSLGSIVRGYKTGVTKWFRKNTEIHDVWHRNFYDHIIRSEEELWKIRRSIQHNPEKRKGTL